MVQSLLLTDNDIDLGTASLKYKSFFAGLVDSENFKVNGGLVAVPSAEVPACPVGVTFASPSTSTDKLPM